jgi:membrane-associated phospholipid phosphatase
LSGVEPVAWGRRRLDRASPRRLGLTVTASAAALVILAVSASRLYLGAHWLTDVLGGYALGAW